MKNIIIILLLLLCPTIASAGVKAKRNTFKNKDVFGIQFSKNRAEYYGKVDSVSTISLQEYYITASGFHILEIGIEMSGSSVQLRIYSIAIIDPSKIMDDAIKSINLASIPSPSLPMLPEPFGKGKGAAESVMNIAVLKEYPITTHAKTIEYKLSTHEDIIRLFVLLRSGWLQEDPPEEDEGDGADGYYLSGESGDEDESDDESDDPSEKEKTKGPPSKNQLGGTLFIITDS